MLLLLAFALTLAVTALVGWWLLKLRQMVRLSLTQALAQLAEPLGRQTKVIELLHQQILNQEQQLKALAQASAQLRQTVAALEQKIADENALTAGDRRVH